MKNITIIETDTSRGLYWAKRDAGEVTAAKEMKQLVIYPDDVLPIGRISHDRQRMWQTYEIGRHVAKKRLGEILGFLY